MDVWDLRLKKSMQVLTTSQRMYHHLHGHVCPGNHEHQRIEGSTVYQGQVIARTKFTEMYPRKFARSVAKTMLHDFNSRPFDDPSFVVSHEPSSRALKQSRSSGFRAKPSIPRAVDPSELPEMKRRRISGKTTVLTSDEWKTCFDQIDQLTPRVGKKTIRDNDVISTLQQLLPDKMIQFVIACRGTDRALGPGIRQLCKGRHHSDDACSNIVNLEPFSSMINGNNGICCHRPKSNGRVILAS